MILNTYKTCMCDVPNCRSTKHCPALYYFFWNKAITFASCDTRNDKRMLYLAGMEIPTEYHVDIQDIFKIKGGGKRDGMTSLAEKIIDISYKEIKGAFDPDHHAH